ncbi:MAG: NADH-quinone oxidoreductase subunit A [Deltaproteobacteria bacterium]|nr:NADH-quinone oxidoreductase subunit A [Deltaproteobacteria bacterium]
MHVHLATVLIFAAVAGAFVFLSLAIGKLLRPDAPTADKSLPYECGERPIGPAHINFNPRFTLVALVFVIFEVEIALVYPVAAVYRSAVESGSGLRAFLALFAFVAVLAIGLAVVWARGDLEWVRALSKPASQAGGEASKQP